MVLGLAIWPFSLYWWKSKTGRLDVCQISCCKVSEDRGYQWCQLKITHIFQKSHMHGINTDGISATALPLCCVCSRLMHLWWCCLVGCNFFLCFSFVCGFDFGGGSGCFVWGGLGGCFEGQLVVFCQMKCHFLVTIRLMAGKVFLLLFFCLT